MNRKQQLLQQQQKVQSMRRYMVDLYIILKDKALVLNSLEN